MSVIRPATEADIPAIVSLATLAGVNPGLGDIACLYESCPDGLFVTDIKGEVAACIAAVAHDRQFGAVGLHIVSPAHRRRGLGDSILKHGLAYLGSRDTSVSCPPEMQPYYNGHGFRASYRCRRYVGIAESYPEQKNVLPPGEVSFADLAAYDGSIFAIERNAFLECWLRQEGGQAAVSISNRRINGYGFLRPGRLGHRLGPLFANSAAAAEKLLKTLSTAIAGQPFFIDIPEANHSAQGLLKPYSLSPVLEMVRMYSGREPASPIGRVYGLTSLEIT